MLTSGQLTHVLRRTFAAHFMMSGGNILALQKILGHHDIKMTMRNGSKVTAAVGITP